MIYGKKLHLDGSETHKASFLDGGLLWAKLIKKEVILDYLETAYVGARMMDDVEMMCRLSRAILAFDYDDLEKNPTWEEMEAAYMFK